MDDTVKSSNIEPGTKEIEDEAVALQTMYIKAEIDDFDDFECQVEDLHHCIDIKEEECDIIHPRRLPIMGERRITRREVFEIWREVAGLRSTKVVHVHNRLTQMFSAENDSDEVKDKLKKAAYATCNKITQRWDKCNRNKERFLIKSSDWLNKEILLPSPDIDKETLPTSQHCCHSDDYQSSDEVLKKRKISELSKMELRSSGNQLNVKLDNGISETTPAQAPVHNRTSPLQFSDDQALSLLIKGKFSKHQYQTIRRYVNEKAVNTYPSYNKIKAATDKCCPSKESVRVNERIAEVRLQNLLDHTASRIIQSQKEIFNGVEQYLHNIVLIVKWGFGGSSGHNQYIQEYPDETFMGDADMFITSLVPIQMFVENTSRVKEILWQNPRSSSQRYCRPIRIQFAKETAELFQHELEYMDNQIKNLIPFEETVSECNIKITYQLVFTTVNDKICNALPTASHAQRCYLCGANFKDMNNIDSVERDIDIRELSFGLSTQHIWMRFFEYFLHLSYRLDLKKLGQKNISVKKKKIKIQKEFSEKLGLIVDQERPGEAGTFNNEYVASRFFGNPSVSAEITGIKQDLIYRCFVILSAMSSGYTICKEQFHIYAKDTAKFLVQEYPWFCMPVTVHKVLLHGAQMISKAILPIGQLAEKAQEMRNQELKLYRVKRSENVSITLRNNEALLCALLCSSDPFITSLMPLPKKTSSKLSKDVSNLLNIPKMEEHEEPFDIDETSGLEDSSETDQYDDDIDFVE